MMLMLVMLIVLNRRRRRVLISWMSADGKRYNVVWIDVVRREGRERSRWRKGKRWRRKV